MARLKSDDYHTKEFGTEGRHFLAGMEAAGYSDEAIESIGTSLGVAQAEFMAWESLRKDNKISDTEAYLRNVLTISMLNPHLWAYLLKPKGTISEDPNILTIENASAEGLAEEGWEEAYRDMIYGKINERDEWAQQYALDNNGEDPTREETFILMEADIQRWSFYLWLVQKQVGER